MTGPSRSLRLLSDDDLAAELRALGGWLDTPVVPTMPGLPDPARRARIRLEAEAARPRPAWRAWWPIERATTRPLRRSLVLAVIALIVLAAIAGAIGFGVPGIRIFFGGQPPASPSASLVPGPTGSPSPSTSATIPGPPGSSLDLGFLTTPSEAPSLTGFGLLAPRDPAVGPADTLWYGQGRLTLVWASRAGLPEIEPPGVGLLLTELRGRVDQEFLGKMIGPGTTLTPARVGDVTGYWISGEVHQLVYLDEHGEVLSDSRRSVGDTLIWTNGDVTFRLETALGRDAAIRIAESIR